jgi:hypothetical protein
MESALSFQYLSALFRSIFVYCMLKHTHRSCVNLVDRHTCVFVRSRRAVRLLALPLAESGLVRVKTCKCMRAVESLPPCPAAASPTPTPTPNEEGALSMESGGGAWMAHVCVRLARARIASSEARRQSLTFFVSALLLVRRLQRRHHVVLLVSVLLFGE